MQSCSSREGGGGGEEEEEEEEEEHPTAFWSSDVAVEFAVRQLYPNIWFILISFTEEDFATRGHGGGNITLIPNIRKQKSIH